MAELVQYSLRLFSPLTSLRISGVSQGIQEGHLSVRCLWVVSIAEFALFHNPGR